MQCANCAKVIPDDSTFCPECGRPAQPAPAAAAPGPGTGYAPPPYQPAGYAPAGAAFYGTRPAKPPNYLVWTIASLLLCLPSAIVAIIFSFQVDSKYNTGDYAGAQAASTRAKTWLLITLVLGVIAFIFYFSAALSSQSQY